MKPYKTVPVLKERIWGGQKLKAYNKCFGSGCVGESWETSCEDGSVPLLVKFIDANDILSVQVHPDDGYAKLMEGQNNGKTEMWVVLDCDEGASIVYGFNRRLNRDELSALIKDNGLQGVLNQVRVRKGDCIFIPAGTVHTLGKGNLVYEVQQYSDITYRLFDWDRTDRSGSSRELHIDKALDVIKFEVPLNPIINIYDFLTDKNINMIQIAKCDYFECFYLRLVECSRCDLAQTGFRAISCISGNAKLVYAEGDIYLKKGESCIIPETYGENSAIASIGNAELIISCYTMLTK